MRRREDLGTGRSPADNQRDRIRARLDQSQPSLDPEHTHRGVEPVGHEAGPGDDGHGQIIGQSHPGRGIDDMRVAVSVGVEMLLGRAGSRDGSIRELEHLRNGLFPGKVVHGDPPPAGAWRRIAEGQALHRGCIRRTGP